MKINHGKVCGELATKLYEAQEQIHAHLARETRLMKALEESAEYFEHMLRGDPAYLPVDPVKTEKLIYNKIKQALATHKEER